MQIPVRIDCECFDSKLCSLCEGEGQFQVWVSLKQVKIDVWGKVHLSFGKQVKPNILMVSIKQVEKAIKKYKKQRKSLSN